MRRAYAFVGLVALAASAISAPAPASAQPASGATAAELVAQGEAHAQDGRYDHALASFKAAAALEPTAGHACYVAYTYFRMQRLPEAWLYFDQARARDDGTAAAWCETTLAADLQRSLRAGSFAPVTITTEPAGARVEISSLAAGEAIDAPRVVWLAYGTHELTVTRAGFRGERVEIAVRSAAPMPVQVALVPEPTTGRATAGAPPRDDVTAPGDAAARDRPRGRPVIAWVTLSVGVATLATGAWFHASAVSSQHQAEDELAGPAFDAHLDDFRRERALALGSYAVGAAVTGVGLYLLLRSPSGADDERHAGVAVAPDSFALWVRWRM